MEGNAGSRQRIGFVLTANFALMSYASAIEPLRAANLLAGAPLYEVVNYSASGEPVRSSAGITVECSDAQQIGSSLHTLFVCAGGQPSDWADRHGLHRTLQKASRLGVRIGGISGGSYVLAAAGLLDGRDFTIHWEHAPGLAEAFPHLKPRQARYVIDGNRITCAGGVAPLEMMRAMITERMGAEFARRVSDWYLHSLIAEADAPQRASHAERFGTHHPGLLTVLQKMETTIERPMDRRAMADLARITPRHLGRLFRSELGVSFLDTYRRIRLEHARRLLQQSPLSVSEIAVACGFSSASHFSRAFKAELGLTPVGVRHAGA